MHWSMVDTLHYPLCRHGRHAGGIVNLRFLMPASKLPGNEAPLAAEGTQIVPAQAGGLNHGGELVNGAPPLLRKGSRPHQLARLPPRRAPVVERLPEMAVAQAISRRPCRLARHMS